MVPNNKYMFTRSCFAYCLIALMLSACSTVPLEPGMVYSSKTRSHLYELAYWTFEGRLSVTGPNDSSSANIIWEHTPTQERLRLAGPLGQGAVIISLIGNEVSIDRGGGDIRRSGGADEFISKELGMIVPVQSLRYWVVGLPEPYKNFQYLGEGFQQGGWLAEFKEMQSVAGELMPRKIAVFNDKVKLKLFIDNWDLRDGNAK